MTEKRKAGSVSRFRSLSLIVVALSEAMANSASAAAVVNAPAAVSVAARGCSGIEITGLDHKFNYQASLLSVESSPFCSKSMVK